MAIGVPRVIDITGKKTAEQIRAEREWERARQTLAAEKRLSGDSLEGWKRRVTKTRSF